MNKPCRLLFLSVLFLGAVSLVSLNAESKESDVYYVSVRILKIFEHKDGYRILYRHTTDENAELLLPKKWLTGAENKADLYYINTRVNPYVSFFIRGGKCEYLRVYVPNNGKDSVWGVLEVPQEYDDKFSGTEEIPLNF